MTKQAKEAIFDSENAPILWKDRKRILGLPITFTRYEVDDDRLTCYKGLFKTTVDEMLLYRILDIKMIRTLGQKICGVGSILLYSADRTDSSFEIKNIKHPDKVRKFLSKLCEHERTERGIRGREMYGTAAAGMLDDFEDESQNDCPNCEH